MSNNNQNNSNNKSNENKFLFGTFIAVLFLSPIAVIILLYTLDITMLNPNADLFETIAFRKKEIAICTVCLYVLAFYLITNWFNFRKPKKTTTLASSEWASIEEQKKSFALAPIDSSQKLDVGGAPINYIDGKYLLYCKDSMHDICVGTTRSGKSRKVVRQLVMLASMANESMIFNDPKKEMYQDFHIYLEKRGYKVYCIDLRNMQYSNCWNPLDTIIDAVNKCDIDNADQYAQDIVTALVVDNGQGEKIWIDGQKALIKGLILANTQANVPENKKNLFSVYKTLAELGEEKAFNNDPKNKKMPLSAYFDSLDEADVARTAFSAIKNSPERTRGSFLTSALATLQIFSSINLMKALGSSDFSFDEFTDGKRALFVVNPDEKKTYDSVASICFSQAYQSLVFKANSLPGRKLKKRVHMIYDEFGNMPPIDAMQSKLTVALSREIVYHLYVQDFGQLDDVYGSDVSKIIRGNCNVWYFIASSDLDTCKEISEKIGNETLWVDSHSGNYNNNANTTGGGLSYQQQTRALKDANELQQSDNRDGHGIIVSCLYSKPCEVYLPDCTKYSWFKELEHDENEVEREHSELTYAIPRYVEISNDEIDGSLSRMNPKRSYKPSPMPNESDLLWYWSMRGDISESVWSHLCKYIAEHNYNLTRNDIKKYMKSKEFLDFMVRTDVSPEVQAIIPEDFINELNNKSNEDKIIFDNKSTRVDTADIEKIINTLKVNFNHVSILDENKTK